jgi:hypothetical protein
MPVTDEGLDGEILKSLIHCPLRYDFDQAVILLDKLICSPELFHTIAIDLINNAPPHLTDLILVHMLELSNNVKEVLYLVQPERLKNFIRNGIENSSSWLESDFASYVVARILESVDSFASFIEVNAIINVLEKNGHAAFLDKVFAEGFAMRGDDIEYVKSAPRSPLAKRMFPQLLSRCLLNMAAAFPNYLGKSENYYVEYRTEFLHLWKLAIKHLNFFNPIALYNKLILPVCKNLHCDKCAPRMVNDFSEQMESPEIIRVLFAMIWMQAGEKEKALEMIPNAEVLEAAMQEFGV